MSTQPIRWALMLLVLILAVFSSGCAVLDSERGGSSDDDDDDQGRDAGAEGDLNLGDLLAPFDSSSESTTDASTSDPGPSLEVIDSPCVATELGDELPVVRSGSTAGDSVFQTASCGDALHRSPEATFWWSPPYAGSFNFSTAQSSFDTVLFILDGDCEGSEVGCSDDVGQGVLTSSVQINLTAGQTIFIVIDGYNGESGSYRLEITGSEQDCTDELDNDGDGLTDCDDSDCAGIDCQDPGDWPAEWARFELGMLAEVNRYRESGYRCHSGQFPATTPLEMNEAIRTAARLHSQDMAENNYFDHDSRDGRSFDQRMSDAGYSGSWPWGENIAAGSTTAASAVSNLLSSTEGHCDNIMSSQYNVIGIGYAYSADSTYGHYWTQDFGGSH